MPALFQGATPEYVNRSSIIDPNPPDNLGGRHYPIQPYRQDGREAYIGLPSRKFEKFIAYYHQVPATKERTIYPTGNIGLVFRCDPHQPGAFLVGTPTRPYEPDYVLPGCDYFVVLFWPGWGYVFHPIPTMELTDRFLPLQELLGGEAERVIECMVQARTFSERIRIFEQVMEGRLKTGAEIPPNLSDIMATVCRNINGLPDEEGEINATPGGRHVRRLFQKYIGISPVLFKRIMRHQYTLRILNLPLHHDMAGLAIDLGYYDQAHLIREFQQFLGLTPNQYIRERVRGPSARIYREQTVKDGSLSSPNKFSP